MDRPENFESSLYKIQVCIHTFSRLPTRVKLAEMLIMRSTAVAFERVRAWRCTVVMGEAQTQAIGRQHSNVGQVKITVWIRRGRIYAASPGILLWLLFGVDIGSHRRRRGSIVIVRSTVKQRMHNWSVSRGIQSVREYGPSSTQSVQPVQCYCCQCGCSPVV